MESFLAAILGPADPEAGWPFLAAGPSQVTGEFGICSGRIDGIQLFSQGGLGEHRVELPVAGGAEFDLWAQLSAPGTGHKMVGCEPRRFPFAERTDRRLLIRVGRRIRW